MKQITSTFLFSQKTFNVTASKLPTKYAVIGMPHQRDAFAYLSDSYRDDLIRLEDCNSYRVFPSLKQAIEFIENSYGHKGCEVAEALAKQMVRWGVLEEVNTDE